MRRLRRLAGLVVPMLLLVLIPGGGIVFIGTSAAGLVDRKIVAINPTIPGVEIHAQATEQIMGSQFLHRSDWVDGAKVILMAMIFGALVVPMHRLDAVGCTLVAACALATVAVTAWYGYTGWHYLIDPGAPMIAVLTACLAGTLSSVLRADGPARS